MFALIFLFIMLGIPTGIIMLIAEILIGYSKDKATREKLENLFPRRDTSHDASFPDLQNTVGGKRQDVNASGSTKKEGAKQYTYTYSSNGTPVQGSTGKTGMSDTQVKWQGNKAEPYARPIKQRRGQTAAAAACFAVSGVTVFAAASDVFSGIAQHGLNNLMAYADSIPMLIVSIACLIAGLWIVISKKRKVDKENRYIAIINQGYGMIPIDNICYLFPKKYDDCVKDLQEMINKGVLPDAYIDYGRRLLVIDPKSSSVEPLIAPEKAGEKAVLTEQAAPSKPARKKAASEADHVDFLSLERLSKKVTDEDIKLKLIRISTTLKTIGQKAEEDPSIRKAAGVDTFMDMYLPKTIKLVEDYEKVDRTANLPEDNELKENILETLDAIDNAAMTLWKDIIHSDMIDISAELNALQTKLEMDGYSESELKGAPEGDVFSQLRKEQVKEKDLVK